MNPKKLNRPESLKSSKKKRLQGRDTAPASSLSLKAFLSHLYPVKIPNKSLQLLSGQRTVFLLITTTETAPAAAESPSSMIQRYAS